MKKLLLFASALAGFFLAASCQQESLEPVGGNTVTYTVQVPGALSTKAIGTDVSKVTELIYEVYRIDENDVETRLYQKKASLSNGTATVELELVNNQDFRVLFWAQVPENGVYTTTSLKEVKLATALNANAENYAAFAGQDEITYGENLTGRTVTLVRPVAQLNIATSAESLKLGEDENGANAQTTVSFKTTAVTVEGLSSVYNVADQSVSATTTTFVYGATLPYDNDANTTDNLSEATIKVNNVDYQYVSMNYVGFAQPSGDNVKVTYTIETKEVGTITNTISNVPVKANYRTNIIGNLITSTSDYTVSLDADWKDVEGGNMEVVVDGLVKNVKGDYEISKTAGLAYAINNLMVDNQGAANDATFYIYPGTYNLSEYEIKQINVTSGTLKVYKSIPVVTRSTNDEVIIIGLEKALISEVADGATVLFSGITIQDFDGTGAALVADNKGKVVLSDCEIINEDGTPDEDTPLVCGNKPENVVGDDSDSYLVYTAEQLAAAFADESVESIALGADIALESTLVFPADRKATLDLRGWNLTIADPDMVANTYAINNLGDLTIKDSYGIGAVTARGIYNGYDDKGEYSETAKLTIVSGTFNAMGTNGGAAVFNYGVADINGGKFESNGGYGLNNQGTGEMTIDNADVRGGVFNRGNLTVDDSKVYQHLSGKHSIYNEGSVTINGGEFDSESGNELIFADGENASVTINDGTFHKTAKSYLYSAAAGKNITFTINGGTHYGYVNQPEMTVDTFRPGAPIVVTGGSYNFDVTNWCHKDYKSVKNAETAMWDVVEKVYVAQAGEEKYESLKDAVNAVMDGETITLVRNVTFNEDTRENSSGTWYEGLYYTGDKSFTIDLSGFTITQNGAVNDYLFLFKNDGEKDNVITFKNGTLDAGTSAFCALCTSTTSTQKITINAENLNIIGNNSNGAVCKIRGGAEFNVKAGTVITGEDSYVGIESYGATTNIYEGAKIYQNGTTSYAGSLVGVSGNGTVNVYGGEGTSAQGAFIAMTSGGTINISGGAWIANTDGTISNDNKGALIAQSDKGAKSIINVTGGTFKGGYNCYGNAVGDAQINIKGGNFNADPAYFLAEGYRTVEKNGVWTVSEELPAAMIGDVKYETLTEAIAAVQEGETVKVCSQITENVKLPATLKNVTIKGEAECLLKDMTISAADGNSYNYENLTFDGLTFYNSRLLFTGWRNGEEVIKNLTVTNCTFTNLYDTTNEAAVHINKDASEAVNGFTFTNNVIDGATGGSKSGVYAQVTGSVTISNNLFNNIVFRPALLQLADSDGIKDDVTVFNNVIANTTRLQIYGSEEGPEDGPWTPCGTDELKLIITNNIFKNISTTHYICTWGINGKTDISHNYYDASPIGRIYWNNELPNDEAGLNVIGAYPIYTELNADGTINTNSLYSPTI